MTTKQTAILWLDSEVNNNDENIAAQERLSSTFEKVRVFEDEHLCRQYIEKYSKKDLFLIVSGRLSRHIVPVIDSYDQIFAIYIYCMDSSRHIEWAKGFTKIRNIITDFNELISAIQSDLKISEENNESDNELSNVHPTTSISSSISKKYSCHIDGYAKVPLCTLEEAIEPLIDLVEDVGEMVWLVKQQAQHPDNGLTCDESASIALYTMEWSTKEKSFGSILNKTLRKENVQQIKPWFRYLRLIFKACSKLPTNSQIIYSTTTKNLNSNYSTGEVFLSWEFMICTSSIQTFTKTGERTLYAIESRTGRNIQQHAYERNKDQVLLLPGRQFQVLSSLNPDHQLTFVQLEEMKPLYTFE